MLWQMSVSNLFTLQYSALVTIVWFVLAYCNGKFFWTVLQKSDIGRNRIKVLNINFDFQVYSYYEIFISLGLESTY